MRGTSSMLRRFMCGRPGIATSNLILTSAATASSYSTIISLADDLTRPMFTSAIPPALNVNFQYHSRSYSSPPSSDAAANVVSIESEEQFNDSLCKAKGMLSLKLETVKRKDESLPAIFYFTAAWCGPCRLLAPVIGELSEKYPHVTTYKIDIDKEGLGNALSKLNIHSVPTLHFFQDGKKAGEVIGADVQRLKDTMESLYKL